MKRIMGLLMALAIALTCLPGFAALAEDRITTTGTVFLREGPGRDYDKICAIDEGTRLTYTRTEKDERGVKWYRVTYDGMRGWVSSKYAKEGSSSNSSGKTVTTTGDVHLRTGPGLDYSDRTIIYAGETMSYDKTEEDDRGVTWYHVSYDGMKGWISSVYAKKGGSASEDRVWMTGNANVRSGPGRDYDSIGTVGDGTSLVYRGRTRTDERGVEWYNVYYRGDSGWVSSVYAWLDD